jgi:hypothetical protein
MSVVTEQMKSFYRRELKQRAVEPIPDDLLIRGGTFIPSPSPVFTHNPSLTTEAAVHSGRMLLCPPCDILLCAKRQWKRHSTFLTAREGDAAYTTQRMDRYAFCSPQIDLATIASWATQLRVDRLLMKLGVCKPKSDEELLGGRIDLVIRRFKFDCLLPGPNQFTWPDGMVYPNDPMKIFDRDKPYRDYLTDTEIWDQRVGEDLHVFRSWNCEVSIAGKFTDGLWNDLAGQSDSPIDLHIKEDLTIEKRERDGALRGVDHYAFVVNPDRISFVSKGAE